VRRNWLAKKLPQEKADKVKAGLLEPQYPVVKPGLMNFDVRVRQKSLVKTTELVGQNSSGKPDETCNLASKVITTRDDLNASNQVHTSVRGKGTTGAYELV
jgi:hypothetical protein